MRTFYALNAAALQVKSALRLVPGTIAFFRFHFFKKKKPRFVLLWKYEWGFIYLCVASW